MNIVLVGFMGSGKTSSAKILAELLNWKVVEVDDLILEKSGKASVKEIFETMGEADFRLFEIGIIKELSQIDKKIISPGGGVIMNHINMLHLKRNGRVFYLKDSFDLITKRLGKETEGRPLLKDREKALKLFNLRCPLYENCADEIVDCENLNPKQIAEIICERVKVYENLK